MSYRGEIRATEKGLRCWRDARAIDMTDVELAAIVAKAKLTVIK